MMVKLRVIAAGDHWQWSNWEV